MWHIAVPWWELIVRAVVVYGFLILLLRLTGKRQVGQLAPFDLVLLLVLSNAVQNSMNAGDNSLVGGLLCAATLIALNYLVKSYGYNPAEHFSDNLVQLLRRKANLEILAKDDME